ncbi:hypothetical protein [Candidatus Nitrosotalea sp. TS]|uniref:hypothetical protein n=1 Tax=Candidatus Nitrosotalea sp. TS TaxID=2341020 RepID=UPI00140C0B57|nr:hypothetical protein [Candidatus Nitrosotalea sp. TS]
MASLETLTKSYKAKKIEVTKLRRKSENNLKVGPFNEEEIIIRACIFGKTKRIFRQAD